MSNNNILFVSGSLASGGAERQIVNLAGLLSDNGYNVHVLCYSFNDFYSSFLLSKGIEIIWLKKGSYFSKLLKCRRLIRNGGFGSVISFLETPNFINEIASIGGKNWTVIIGERSSQNKVFFSRRGRLYSLFHKYADALVCNSHNAEQMWRDYPKVKIPKIVTIYNLIRIKEVKSTYKFRRDGVLHFLVAASYQPIKNMRGLAKALLLLSDEERCSVCVDWYGRKEYSNGNDNAFKDIESFVDSNQLSETLHLHGDTKDIHELMYQADVIGLFSKAEGLPNSICEGMFLGKPIIMTRVSDYDTLVRPENGKLCDWDNPESIADAIRFYIGLSQDELLSMGNASKVKAEQLFSDEAVLNKWRDLLDKRDCK